MKTMDVENDRIQEIRRAFDHAGISISEWARINGFSSSLVYQILEGKRLCKRGQCHKIAVALGLKSGKIVEINELSVLMKITEGR